ncbi:arsenicals resistance [Friedmanniomyces endolithicus]|uniref:Arsenicals resistance n=1 Tax=Friedmanniomyces endolithicus TaxID=329885 RepID=A0AAN6KG42_9PEZI|nr:arsenicals resistance [Friedmanniomyces endolithicus]KAK0781590.1 arsenicals resistance [Friedmanniomyces endolithicus]KAK0786541.1 arsenicals resistance [Friedmanniomyces endolithicus]KAK0810381.1 arsenicals resistance [Friedmanniomyces endolithicus]KAK0848447.1 arsenicals resistance [Friedmanniomyces endolithicus]
MNTIEPGVADDARPDAGLGRVNSNELSRVKGGEAVDDDNIELGEVDADGRKNHDNNGTQNNDEPITAPPFKALSFLDRLLVLWIILSMAIGIILGNLIPSVGPALQRGTFVGVSGPIAAGLLVMMYPILCKVRYETLHLLLRTKKLWIQIGISFVINWIIAPFFMTALAWAFLPDRRDLRDGLIFVGVARCIAMVLIWTDLAGGDADYCAVLVAFNSILQIVLFAPMAVLLVSKVSGDPASAGKDLYQDAATSVAVFLGIPLAAAVLTRLSLRWLLGEHKYQHYFIRFVAPFSLIGLLYTIVVLFASQGAHVVQQITSVLRVCAPLVVYFLVIFPATAWMMYRAGFGYKISATQSFTAASNNFELAIAVVVATYGPGSEQALAATVGPLIEVPVLVGLVYVIRYFKHRWGWKEPS